MTKNEILLKVAKGELTPEQAMALLPDGNAQSSGPVSVKANPVTRSISVYGLGRMPTTLYRSQWERLLGNDPKKAPTDAAKTVLEFIAKHAAYLPTTKGGEAKDVPAALIGEGKPFRMPKEKEVA